MRLYSAKVHVDALIKLHSGLPFVELKGQVEEMQLANNSVNNWGSTWQSQHSIAD